MNALARAALKRRLSKTARALAYTMLDRASLADISACFVDRLARSADIRLLLYDTQTDTVRLAASALEFVEQLESGMIADAVPWLVKAGSIVPKDGLVVDAGGYRGITAQWFSKRATVVHTFEPVPESAQNIRTTIALRGLQNILVHEMAVSDKVGTSRLHVLRGRGHSSLGEVATSPLDYTIDVSTISLDIFAANNALPRIDCLKLDVEGFEFEALVGCAGLLEEKKIGLIIFEINGPILLSLSKTAGSIYDLLQRYDYTVFDFDGSRISKTRFNTAGIEDFIAQPRTAG
jgi:FkbM family methyltransferase